MYKTYKVVQLYQGLEGDLNGYVLSTHTNKQNARRYARALRSLGHIALYTAQNVREIDYVRLARRYRSYDDGNFRPAWSVR